MSALASSLWGALGGRTEQLARVRVSDRGAWLGGALAADELALGAVSSALLAAGELARARGWEAPEIELSAEHVALSFHSERNVLLNGRPAGAGFAPLSRFVRCAGGGWARTHGNYPHHAAALASAVGLDAELRGEDALRALKSRALELDAVALEDAVAAAGGCAAAVRTAEQWRVHPTGRAAGLDPLVAWEEHGTEGRDHARRGRSGVGNVVGTSSPRRLAALGDPARPAAGVRVLELTRVIAGPVAGRTLAALGAEVLRVDPPALPELEAQHLDSDAGKRSALLDLADAGRREALLEGADVVLIGYRAGSLDRFDMRPEQLAARHPHLVQVWLSAWGVNGPWAQRRGFDSLVQAASGVAAECAGGGENADGTPGALPAQALDHATGQLMAGAALMALARRERGLGVPAARLSLARTAHELLSAPGARDGAGDVSGRADPDRHRVSFGELSLIAPPGMLDGVPLSWPHGPRPFGGDAPRWS